ncbi:MAG: hypothetical protein IKC35_01200 [Clostridia bacterium]|nr:hypothetical protein [Clostridia bacterium]
MNIDAFLPLLLKGNGNFDLIKILSAIKCGDKNKAIEAIIPSNEQTEPLMSILKAANKKPPLAGLGAIEGFASNEILGMLVKYYSY